MTLDCTTCGACCVTPDGSLAAGVTRSDERRLGTLFVVLKVKRWPGLPPGITGTIRTRQAQDGVRCVCLKGKVGEGVGCSVYDRRPDLCRELVPGSTACLAARARSGLPG